MLEDHRCTFCDKRSCFGECELLAGIEKAVAAGTMVVFDPSNPAHDVNEIMALLRPDPWGNAARMAGA